MRSTFAISIRECTRPVVLVGPVGAGKTTLARRLHERSGRPGPLICISAGELTQNLYGDSLFGHVSGAFTGARGSRKGAFTEARRGTLLLDDLAVMRPEVQAAVLRVLESGRFRPLGGAEDEVADCRIVFASTERPGDLVRTGRPPPRCR